MDDYKKAKEATNWWICQMTKRCQDLYPHKVIGNNPSELEIVDDCLKNELSRFRDALFKQILFNIQYQLYLSLTCCYWRPSGDLRTLVRKTSIPNEYFPERANMQIYEGFVEVSVNGEELHLLPLLTQ